MKLSERLRELLNWFRSRKEDVGWGVAGQCPHCNSTQARLINGWQNNQGFGKAQFWCLTCDKIFTWRRLPKPGKEAYVGQYR